MRTDWQNKWLKMDLTHPKIQEMADAVEKFCYGWYKASKTHKRVLVLVGNPGCGKTRAVKKIASWARFIAFDAFLKDYWKTIPSSTYSHWPALCDDFKNGCFGVLRDLADTSLVVIDDIGAEYDPSRMGTDKLCQTLTKRDGMWTVLTTNIQPDAWSTRFDERVADRLFRNSTVVDMTDVPSYAVISQSLRI